MTQLLGITKVVHISGSSIILPNINFFSTAPWCQSFVGLDGSPIISMNSVKRNGFVISKSFPTEFSCKRFALQVWADQWWKLTLMSASKLFYKETKLLSKIFCSIFLDHLNIPRYFVHGFASWRCGWSMTVTYTVCSFPDSYLANIRWTRLPTRVGKCAVFSWLFDWLFQKMICWTCSGLINGRNFHCLLLFRFAQRIPK